MDNDKGQIKIYEDLYSIEYDDATKALDSDDIHDKTNALISLTLKGADLKFMQDICIKYSNEKDELLRGDAILCFGHLARIHGRLDLDLVLPIIKKALNDESAFIRGQAYSAMDDIDFFIIHNHPSKLKQLINKLKSFLEQISKKRS